MIVIYEDGDEISMVEAKSLTFHDEGDAKRAMIDSKRSTPLPKVEYGRFPILQDLMVQPDVIDIRPIQVESDVGAIEKPLCSESRYEVMGLLRDLLDMVKYKMADPDEDTPTDPEVSEDTDE